MAASFDKTFSQAPFGAISPGGQGSGSSGPTPAAATPTSPGTVTSFGRSGQGHVDSLLYGVKWGTGGAGGGADVTYSFGTSRSVYSADYANQEPFTGFGELSPIQKTAVGNALSAWGDIADISFTQVTDSDTVAGDLRFAKSSAPTTAWSYVPGPFTESGDAWISHGQRYETATPGSYGYFTFMHEIGHTLGLTHPHEGAGISVPADPSIDSTAVSIMSYRSYENAPLDGYTQNFFPTTPMLNDIAALQYIYGANMSTHAGDDVYRWEPGEQLLESLWDAGGNDTIDWSNQTGAAVIDLNPGAWSELGPAYWSGLAYQSETLAIAYDVTIENASGGAGDDRITGNSGGNLLVGNGGADSLYGGTGGDQLEGGAGNDLLVGGAGDDIARFAGALLDYDVLPDDDAFTVIDLNAADGNDGEDSLAEIERLQFQDGMLSLLDNRTPDAADDQYVARNGEMLVVSAAAGVLANDGDADGDPLTVQLVQTASNGTLSLSGDGSFSYVPDTGFSGADRFSYSVSDGRGGSDSATAAITVEPAAPASQGPVAIDDQDATFAGRRTIVNVLGNDLDPDGGSLRIGSADQPENGSVRVNRYGTKLTYKADADFTGTDSFSYTVTDDDGGTDTGTVTVSVYPDTQAAGALIAVDDQAAGVAGDAVTIQALDNDLDGVGGRLRIASFGQAEHGATSANKAGTRLFYHPDEGFTGTDSFTYAAGNEAGTIGEATVTVAVLPESGPSAVAGLAATQGSGGESLTVDDLFHDQGGDLAMLGPSVAAPLDATGGGTPAFFGPTCLKDILGDDPNLPVAVS